MWEASTAHFRIPCAVVVRLADMLPPVDEVEEDERPTQGVVYEVENPAHVLQRNLTVSGRRQTLAL